MGTIIRGVKNAFRNSIRTTSIVLILSISIAKQIVDLHSGEITASSTAGNGSEFSIKLLK